ncbi:MAG: polysaccharide biosynthesis protein [Alphaproteobacteria bacterium]|nr:polysaccharide biosynthesis protein [Alphaproteobacteria bacterium]
MRSLRLDRPYMAMVHDLVMAAASFVLSLYLRRGGTFWDESGEFLLEGTLLFTAVCGVVFLSMRLYRGVWRYASMPDLIALIKAATLAILVFLPIMFLMTRLEAFPRSSLLINWFVLLALLGGPRFVYRLVKDGSFANVLERHARARVPVLLVGAGDQADHFIREMARDPEASYRVVGLIADAPGTVGRNIQGVRVYGTLDQIPAVVEKLRRRAERPQRLVLATDAIDGATVQRLLAVAEGLGMTIARLPRLTDFRPHAAGGAEVRPVALEDLLGRPQTVLDRDQMRALVQGRRVLVTGAGGTIGSELVRQVAAFAPAHVALLDSAEFNLYRIDTELGDRDPRLSRSAILADVRDRSRVSQAIAREGPAIVFHAAALKHVPLVEANPDEGVLTNVIGTCNVADACRAAGVGAMVLISTDKAVDPASIMGATKRIAEGYVQALNGAGGGVTRFITVRFGNVLGSTGSVVTRFQEQLAAGGPLTVTHPEMRRYFMTVREAVELILQASALGSEGAAGGGDLYVLEMGQPVRILDLAEQMIRLAGLRPGRDIRIAFTGVRPGEKLQETLFHVDEAPLPTARPGILLARSRPVALEPLRRRLDRLEVCALQRRTEETLALVRALVPEWAAPAIAADRAAQ